MSIHKLLTHANEPLGHILGKQFEDDFTERAVASGLSDEQAKSAFNANMLESGVLTEGPAQFGRTHNRRWLVSDFEAGDVVLHNTYMVGLSSATDSFRVDNFGCFLLIYPELSDTRFHGKPRLKQCYQTSNRPAICRFVQTLG